MRLFSLTLLGDLLSSWELRPAPSIYQYDLSPLEESQQYGFELDEREPNTEYQVSIGDIPASAPPVARRKQVIWDDSLYFESAQGRVEIHLKSRPYGSTAPWTLRLTVTVYVNPTKLNDLRYHSMFQQIKKLGAGLVFDLVSKAGRSLELGVATSGVSTRSSQMELEAISAVWKLVADALSKIAGDPVRGLTAREELRACWGGERISPTSLSRLASQGIDPRRTGAPRPFAAVCHAIHTSTDIPEHRAISGSLAFLRSRIAECKDSVFAHMAAIEADRPMRDRRMSGMPSLYETNDVPRLEHLRAALAKADRLLNFIQSAERLPFLRGLRRSMSFPNSPVFRYIEAYHQLRRAVENYLVSSTIVLDEGTELRLKSTQRMYEQWTFMQLASALRKVGLHCLSGAGLLSRRTRYRYTLDIDRGTTLSFADQNGRVVHLRYEPYIYSERTARQRRDLAVYQGEAADLAWSPDILLEITEAGSDGIIVEHAVVLDAKYTRTIHEHHWGDTVKYLRLRSLHDGRQVARQLWLVHPSDSVDPIRFQDNSVRWTENGPSRPVTETLQGILALVPSDIIDDHGDDDGWLSQPSEPAIRFVMGLARYFQLAC